MQLLKERKQGNIGPIFSSTMMLLKLEYWVLWKLKEKKMKIFNEAGNENVIYLPTKKH